MTLAAGARFGPYEIRDLIGRGGMGEVYRAFDARLGREVAIKGLAAMVQPIEGFESAALTEPGMVVGTVGYMSPEQLSGKPLTPATDIFSFGCLAYEMLLRAKPFTGDSSIEVIASILRDDPFARENDVPIDLRAFIARCLAKRPENRFQNGAELRAALRE